MLYVSFISGSKLVRSLINMFHLYLRMTLRIITLLLVLSACAPQVALEAPEPIAQPPIVALPVPPPAESAAPVEVLVAVPNLVDTSELHQLTRAGIVSILGEPNLYRKEADIHVLLYSKGNCALHLFLNPPTVGAPAVVEFIETIPQVPETDSDRACFSSLLARKKN